VGLGLYEATGEEGHVVRRELCWCYGRLCLCECVCVCVSVCGVCECVCRSVSVWCV